jgi:hypothetical protein
MKYLDKKDFDYYPGKVNIVKPLGTVSLRQFIEAQKSPKPSIVGVFKRIAQAEASGDKAMKAYLKQNKLFYFNPCITLDGQGRSYSNITGFTGIAVLDFDHIEFAEEFRDALFERMKCIIAAYVSPSKKGVKFLVRIPVVDTVEEYKSYFYGLAYFMERFDGFDGCNQNPALPLFLSWDPDIKFREDPSIWDKKGEKIDEFPNEAPEGFEPVEEVTDSKVKKVLSQIKYNIDKADEEGVGHVNVRNAGLIAGGYVAGGYLTEEQATTHAYDFMDNSDYLQKGLNNYKKTFRQMLVRGQVVPILLKEDQDG